MGGKNSKQNPKTTDHTKQKVHEWNPINDILSQHTIESLKNKWDRQELFLYEERIKPMHRHGWTPEQFEKLFPNLAQQKSILSQKTRRKIFDLFHRMHHGENLTNQELLEGLTIIKKSDSADIVSKLVFYLYSDGKQTISRQGFDLFEKQNQTRTKQRSNIFNGEIGKDNVTVQQFRTIFDKYELVKFQELFEADFVLEERYLIEHLKIVESFSREVGSEVFLVEFQWYLQWKDYMRKCHGIDPRIKDREEPISRESQLQKSRIKLQSQTSLYESKLIKAETKRPGVIPNYQLIGDELDQLKRGMKEFVDYVMVPGWLWHSFETIYMGRPTIKRLYPQVYCLKVYQVFIDEDAKFIPNVTEQLQLSYLQMKIKEVFNPKYFEGSVCMHKYPGIENWQKTEDFDLTIRQWGVDNCKIFICFVDKRLVSKFIKRYNVETDSNENKSCQERIKNYGTILDVYIRGVLKKGFVIKISADSVYLEYRNQQNSRFQKRFPINVLNALNRSPYRLTEPKNLLAHFIDSNKNRSYLHSIIQCLIRTPFFGGYLEDVHSKIKNQNLLIYNISKIFSESRKNKDSIEVTQQMNKIQSIIKSKYKAFEFTPFYFLQKLLIEMEKQFKDQRKDIVQADKYDDEGNRNIKIQQFFQTEGEEHFKCRSCQKQWKNNQDLYGHRLEIPEYKRIEVYFYVFPKYKVAHWMPVKHGIQIQKTVKTQQFLSMVAEQIKLDRDHFKAYAEINGALEHDLNEQKRQNQMAEYLEAGARILIFEIKSSQNLFFQIQNRKTTTRNNRDFHAMSVPILIQVEKDNNWGDIMQEIREIYIGKFGVEEKNAIGSNRSIYKSLRHAKSGMIPSRREFQYGEEEIGVSNREPDMMEASMLGGSVRKSNPSIGNLNKSEVKTNEYYTVRAIKKDQPQYCFKCKKRFVKTGNALTNQCKGDCIKDSLIISEDSSIKKHYNKICIVVDWDRQQSLSFTGFNHTTSPRAAKLYQENKEKIPNINKMIENNQNFLEHIECQNCHEHTAEKSIIIEKNPNVLIIQLKRYRENGNIKQNKVGYDEKLIHNGEMYELFGVVVPDLNDYPYQRDIFYNYVKCDSYEEWFKCDSYGVREDMSNDHIAEDAYIFFYRKTNIDTALLFYNPLI